MSDEDYCFFDDFGYLNYSHDDDDDDDYNDDFYDEDLDDHCIYLSGCYGGEDVDEDYIYTEKATQKLSAEENDRKTIYNELGLQDPNYLLKNPPSLLDICAQKIALNFPYAYVEDKQPPVPENVQLKIIQFSFPQSMEKIKRYCVLNNGSSTEFDRAIRNVKSVKDVTQIGFHLSANVESRGYRDILYGGPPAKKSPDLYCTIKFDRGKITETHCPCETSSSWCFHVIAVCLARIFLHKKCVFKPPLSDSLNNLKSYAQLRTFTQYLIAEFSDSRIIESAQNILDRILTPRHEENDAINEVWGAPDPTAGPGIGESSQWLICEEGLKTRCTSLIRNSDISEGCWGLNVAELSATSAVMEWWRMVQLDKPVVEDYFCEFPENSRNTQFSYNYYRHSYSREKSLEISKFLKNCEGLLKDDFRYSLKAVKTFTAQLMDVIEERNQRGSYRYDRKVFESNYHLGCIPRPKECWLFRDQLARLWRLLVLNPALTSKEREEIFTTLESLEAKLVHGDCGSAKKDCLHWDSPKHIRHLKGFSWERLELGEDPFKNDNLAEVIINQCVVVETGKCNPTQCPDDVRDHFSYPVSLTCGSFTSSVTVLCFMVEALSVYGHTEQAVHLSMALGLAIVRYYNAWLEGTMRVPVKETICVDLDNSESANSSDKLGKKGKRGAGRKRRRKNNKKNESEKDKAEKKSPKEYIFDEETGVIPITSFAFLLQILEEHEALVGEMLKLVKLQNRGLVDEEMMDCDDVTNDARSLIFRLGVVGLAMPKIQAPSLQTQVEWFNWETYVAEKTMNSSFSVFDLEFLRKMTARAMSLFDNDTGFQPPYALVMTLFKHLYQPEQPLSEPSEDAWAVAMKTIKTSTDRPLKPTIHKRMFFESCRRHWVKLAETVAYTAATSRDLLNKLLHELFSASVMIGSPVNDVILTSQSAGSRKPSSGDKKACLIQQMLPEKVIAALYLSHALVHCADKIRLSELSTRDKTSGSVSSPVKSERRNFEKLHVGGRKILVKEQPVSDRRRLLYETAIKVGTHAYAVKNKVFHQLQVDSYCLEYNFPEFLQRNLGWLCRISEKIDVRAFDLILERQNSDPGPIKCFSDDEVLRLCSLMLESDQKREDRVWIMVRDSLLTLLKPEEKKINEILQLCRTLEKERPEKRALLFPAICKEMLTYLPATSLSKSSKLDYLARSMKLMQTLFTDSETDDNQDTLSGLKELFADSSVSSNDMPGTSKESRAKPTLDLNLQLSFDLAIESVKHIDENDRIRGYESRRRFENMCDVVVLVAKKARATSSRPPSEAAVQINDQKARDNGPEYEEAYISRFVEALCNTFKDCLLLTDSYFELSSRLLDVPHHRSFGRDKVLFSDDCKLSILCKSCSSLSVLLKRCIAGLRETTHGPIMNQFVKETTQETKSYLKSRAKHNKFYYGSSLVSVLEVLKRLMAIADDDDFDSFSHRLAAKHPVTKTAVEEVSSKNRGSSREYDEPLVREDLISSFILGRMLHPEFDCYDYAYDSDGWRY